MKDGGPDEMREYFIDNPSCVAPFTVEVYKDTEDIQTMYTLDITLLGHIYTRKIGSRLEAIIIAKDIARALEDAFRHTYEDKSDIV
jgi:hypothetical protein